MKYTLGLKKLPFEPDAKQIIFIQGNEDDVIYHFVELYYNSIHRYFESKGYDFCYIPYLKRELNESEVLHYNAPYAKSGHLKFMTDDNFILNYMAHPENRTNISPSLLYYIPNYRNESYPEADVLFRGITLTSDSFAGDNELKGILNDIIQDINKQTEPPIRFSKVSRQKIAEERSCFCEEEDPSNIILADDTFDYESKLLLKEIEDRIEKLKKKGISTYIIKQLAFNSNERLSRIRISKRNEILLLDYFMEIKMTPLPLAVFLLFLNHPEGIYFKDLPDYREELMEIYKKIKGPFFNYESAKKSIDDVTNPLSNSINEKCSRIREAFVSQFDDHLARFYYIVGQRGELKKITLPRNLVEWG